MFCFNLEEAAVGDSHVFLGFQHGSGSGVKAIMLLSLPLPLPLSIGLNCFGL